MAKVLGIMTAAFLVGLPGVASAGGANFGGSRSSGTTTFTVEIPPVAAALAAQRDGAIGLWTIANPHDGLMLNLPKGASDGNAVGTIYNGVETVFDASLESNPYLELMAGDASDSSGLRRQDLAFRRTSAAAQGTGQVAVIMVVTGV